MKHSLTYLLSELALYAQKSGLLRAEDETYVMNAWLSLLHAGELSEERACEARSAEEILSELCDLAGENGVIDKESTAERELLDTALMGVLTPRPSEVIDRFYTLYEKDPKAATTDFYRMQGLVNYIRTARVAKDLKWQVESPYGVMDITINLSKPEKDPKAIAAAKLQKASGYPKCLLCHECEGFAGDITRPARQNLRQIPVEMAGKRWYLQYSPYVYYNEHCIALSAAHEPMRIDRSSFEKALDFVTVFPHYFIGQRGSSDRWRLDPLARPYAGRSVHLCNGKGADQKRALLCGIFGRACRHRCLADVRHPSGERKKGGPRPSCG